MSERPFPSVTVKSGRYSLALADYAAKNRLVSAAEESCRKRYEQSKMIEYEPPGRALEMPENHHRKICKEETDGTDEPPAVLHGMYAQKVSERVSSRN